jgi:hypothetical protein
MKFLIFSVESFSFCLLNILVFCVEILCFVELFFVLNLFSVCDEFVLC